MAKKKQVRHKRKPKMDPDSPYEDRPVLEIDEDNLDTEWKDQPKLYEYWAVKLADAKFEHDEAKARLDVTKAEIAKDVREDPVAYDLEKVTVDNVNTAVTVSPEVKAATTMLHKAKHQVAILDAVVTALDHRKKALENLVFLHGQGYFAEPRARDVDSREVVEEAGKRRVRRKGTRKS